ncbi:hypothetical protein [Paraburkholderia hospita]|uniref:hypothetical protein n=1 Tax=Paraburkholderia hospita TaxID=169430 RepID=UPI0002718B15|nr:hypothetical protein [Paraburkholderia hospita]EUC14734.1 hypothetical protein PMI06_006560 [Burkholderia sp. BT03]SKC94012.1 hypothetical protein SAMN06266956_5871 [Paraburkholderia hospita]
MKRLLAWIAAARWRLSLSHCIEGLLIQIPLGLLIDFRVGALGVVVWYWSRKKLEIERDAKTSGQSDATVWTVGWFPWTWDPYKLLDLVLPAISSSLIGAALLSWRGLFRL